MEAFPMLCPWSFLSLILSPLPIITRRWEDFEDRGRPLLVWWYWFVVVLVVLLWFEGFLRTQQKGLEGDQQATCWFCYVLDMPQTLFVFMVFLYLLCSLPALGLNSIPVMLLTNQIWCSSPFPIYCSLPSSPGHRLSWDQNLSYLASPGTLNRDSCIE